MSDRLRMGLSIDGEPNAPEITLPTEDAIRLYQMARMWLAVLGVIQQREELRLMPPELAESESRSVAALGSALRAVGLTIREGASS